MSEMLVKDFAHPGFLKECILEKFRRIRPARKITCRNGEYIYTYFTLALFSQPSR